MEENENILENEELSGEQLSEILRIRREKLSELVQNGQNPFDKVKYEVTSSSARIISDFENMENQTVSLAGRLMSRRDMGKANFFDLMDAEGRIQCYIRINDVGEETFLAYKKWDIGDIIGIRGEVFRTHKGEISVHVKEIELLAKSLLPLPEKYHGLKDTDTRYRQRYLDLIVNPEVKETFVKRSRILKEIR
ncbi:MAG: lysine--tRNA ligase, partial [Clostridia bacterium]|nr:lysine--tRNA ligase [Clostridia bacterium]